MYNYTPPEYTAVYLGRVLFQMHRGLHGSTTRTCTLAVYVPMHSSFDFPLIFQQNSNPNSLIFVLNTPNMIFNTPKHLHMPYSSSKDLKTSNTTQIKTWNMPFVNLQQRIRISISLKTNLHTAIEVKDMKSVFS